MTREEDFVKEIQNYPKKIRYDDLINILIDYPIPNPQSPKKYISIKYNILRKILINLNT